jgi:hypothetical protein
MRVVGDVQWVGAGQEQSIGLAGKNATEDRQGPCVDDAVRCDNPCTSFVFGWTQLPPKF